MMLCVFVFYLLIGNEGMSEKTIQKKTRKMCSSCQRPEVACICRFTIRIDNKIKVVVLQHPDEVKHVKGTISLLAKSLQNCEVIVDESFSNNIQLSYVLNHYQPILLYPSKTSKTLSYDVIYNKEQGVLDKPLCLIILDATWRKAYRMFMSSKLLQTLPQAHLPDELANSGQYVIRKVAKKNALSSLEACCYGLTLVDFIINVQHNDQRLKMPMHYSDIYQPLINKFKEFNQFQLSFIPDIE